MSAYPTAAGVYAVWLRLAQQRALDVGRLGRLAFPAGDYTYVGSAFGPGGIRARLERHLRPEKQLHWHIDWLLQAAQVTTVWWAASTERLECAWVRALLTAEGASASAPAPGFGASDCRCGCPAHLLFFGTIGPESAWRQRLEKIRSRLPGVGPDCGYDYRPGSNYEDPHSPEPRHG